jgi:hypothetical protein
LQAQPAFRFEKLVVFQVQLTRGIETLPITRDYMGVAECSLPLAKCGNRLRLQNAIAAF